MLVRVAIALATAGCIGDRSFRCATSEACGASGTCEPVGVCSFADASCPSGRRYGEHSSPYANTCVGAIAGDDAGIDAPPVTPNDRDGDGVANADDNCPDTGNANQDNEDGDRFGDACDPCPPVADDAPADGDGDGVADACDPNPGTGGDRIHLFEGFQRMPVGWETAGTWTLVGDDVSASAASGAHALLAQPAPTTGHETISTSVTVVSANGTINNVAVFDQHGVGTDSELVCAVYSNPPATPPIGLTLAVPNVGSTASTAYEFMVGGTYAIRQRRDGTSYGCSAARGATAQMVTGSNPLNNTPFSLGIRVSGASARFAWFLVVSSP
jgi:hypothetical protein